jgi:hypothetical protein
MSAGEMIVRAFHARTAAHIAHLQTRSYAEHKALNDFYDGIVGIADEFAETYQGMFGLIGEYPVVAMPTGKACDWIEEFRNWLKTSRATCCKGETALENIHDTLVALCASTCYKLRFLDSGTESAGHEAMEAGYMKMGKW